MIVYHGSDHILELPVFHGGKPQNDYGSGFYMIAGKALRFLSAVLREPGIRISTRTGLKK